MIQRVVIWLKPPTLDDQLDSNTARLLYYSLLVMYLTIVASRILAFVQPELMTNTNIVLVVSTPVFVLSLRFLHIGRIRMVAWIVTIFLVLVATWLTLTSRGILGPYPMIFMLPILLAGMVFRVRHSILLTLIVSGFVTFVLLLDLSAPLLDSEVRGNLVSNWLAFITIYFLATSLVIYARGLIGQTLSELTERNKSLEAEVVVRKLTEEELRTSESKFRQLTEHAISGIYMIADGDKPHFIYANPGMEHIFGYPSQEIMDHLSPADLIHPDDHVRLTNRLNDRFSGRVQLPPARWRARHKDGSEKLILASSVPITYMGKQVLIGTVIDITAEREAEQARIESQAHQKHVAFLNDFIGTMTHDLKTPLNVINTSAYLAQKAKDDDRRQKHLDKIFDEVKHVSVIINNILTVSRLDTMPALRLVPTDLNECILNVRDQLQSRFVAKNLLVNLDLAEKLHAVEAEPEELLRALTNLIENAVNYTPQGGSVMVRTNEIDEGVIVEIQDTGIGIPEDEIPHVFDRFRRASNAQKMPGGTGLGLAIVDRIIKLHQAKIDVFSELGVGTRFVIQFSKLARNSTNQAS